MGPPDPGLRIEPGPGKTMRIRYSISSERPAAHRAEVSMEIDDVPRSSVDLVLPSWVPGSYEILPFARALSRVHAQRTDGRGDLAVTRIDKARWRVATDGAPSVEVRYSVYAHDLVDDGIDITDQHFFLNPARCFPYVDGRQAEPHDVILHLPPGWKAYAELASVGTHPPRFRARDYDELVDSPIDCGTPTELVARPTGIPHRILLCGERGNYEAHRLEEDITKMVDATVRLFGDSPLPHYTFFFHLTEKRWGGLEHLFSTSILVPRTGFRPEREYEHFLWLVSHEYFHLYNVKRIRPKVLGPFDYTRENYTRLLWAMEGSTDYYSLLVLRRADLFTPAKFLEKLAEEIHAYRNTPGRAVVSAEESSMQTWVDLYLPFEESHNQSVSYYRKGELVSLALDLDIRRRTENRVSLDDVWRRLWRDYGKVGRGLEEDDMPKIVSEVTGLDVVPFFRRFVSGTEELDLETALRSAGLRLQTEEKPKGQEDEPDAGYLGVQLQNESGFAKVREVLEGSPGRRAGLSPGDEIVAIDGVKVTHDEFPKAMQRYPPGTTVEITAFRRGVLVRLPATTGKAPPAKYGIATVEDATPLERRVYESWLEAKWAPTQAAEPPPPTGRFASAAGVTTEA